MYAYNYTHSTCKHTHLNIYVQPCIYTCNHTYMDIYNYTINFYYVRSYIICEGLQKTILIDTVINTCIYRHGGGGWFVAIK